MGETGERGDKGGHVVGMNGSFGFWRITKSRC